MTEFAPSEEFVLMCDVPSCEARVSLVAGVDRSEHGWGRVTVYADMVSAKDYDLCVQHYDATLKALAGL